MNAYVRAETCYGGDSIDWSELDEWQRSAHPWTVTLHFRRRQMTTSFFMGSALTHEPTASEVLGSLLLDASADDTDSFEEWAAEFGYDTDSRRAEKTYLACVETAKRLRHLLGDDYEEFRSMDEEELVRRCK